jgi:hypothetical protein
MVESTELVDNSDQSSITIEDLIQIFEEHIKTTSLKKKNTNAPAGFDSALKNAASDPVAKAFLDRGLGTWFALFCLQEHEAEAVYKLPSETISSLAEQVASIPIPTTTLNLLRHLTTTSSRADKRKCEFT